MNFELADWLLTYLAHSTVLLGAAWLASRAISEHRLALREALWRLALVGGLITATLQLATGIEAAAGSWSLAETEVGPRALSASPPPALVAPAAGAVASRPAPAIAPPPSSSPNAPGSWRAWLAGLWALAAATLLAVLALSYIRFRRLLRDRNDLGEGALPTTLRRLERLAREDTIELAPVRLTATPKIGVALARGVRRPEICLPEETLELFSIERHEIVLAHELAHLHRRDPLWFALTRIVERLLFFQPLNRLARRRLQEISEFRCDDWAVHVTRRPISLAKTLTDVAELNLDNKTPLLAPTLAADRTNLGRRVARLLKRSYPMPSDKLPRWITPVSILLLGLTVWIAPGIRASASPALDPEAPATVSAVPEAPEDASGAPTAALAPPAPLPPLAPEAPPAPARVGSAPQRVAPAPPAPATAPVPATAPALAPRDSSVPLAPTAPTAATAPAAPTAPTPPVSEHLHQDGWVFPAEDFAVALGDFTALADTFDADFAAVVADAASVAPSMRAVEEAALAAEASSEWIEALDFDQERLQSLREMTERLERAGYATEAETARLAEMAERLIETAEPNAERLREMRERAQEMAELQQEALSRHRELARAFEESHREAIETIRAETRRAFEETAAERRELLERARQAREEARLVGELESRGELREEMLRMRHELNQQLRELEEELARDSGEGTADRADEDKQ